MMKLTIYLAAFIATLVSAHAVPAVGLANVEGRAAELNTDNTDTPPGGSCGVAFAHTELSGQTKWLRHTDGGLSRFDFQARSAKVEGSCQCTFYEKFPCLDGGWTTGQFVGNLPFAADCYRC